MRSLLASALFARFFNEMETCVPKRLVLTLGVGSIVLFTFFVLPETRFNNVEPLLSEQNQGRSDKKPEIENAEARETHNIPVQILGMELKGAIRNDDDSRAAWLYQQRVGINILIRSGYVKSAVMRVDNSGPPPPQVSYSIEPESTALECAGGKTDDREGQDGVAELQASDATKVEAQASNQAENQSPPSDDSTQALEVTAQRLAIIAVAVEKFHRTALHRKAEWIYAGATLKVFGRLPDLSLGPAQIRPSRIRQIAAEVGASDERYKLFRLTDTELAEALSNECRSLRMATMIMYHYLKKVSDCQKTTKTEGRTKCPDDWNIFAARSYIGQRRTTNAVIDYAPTVARMVDTFGQ